MNTFLFGESEQALRRVIHAENAFIFSVNHHAVGNAVKGGIQFRRARPYFVQQSLAFRFRALALSDIAHNANRADYVFLPVPNRRHAHLAVPQFARRNVAYKFADAA
ncbi:MAG: hypothetical protein BWY76_02193 [bacterium ADurb.Bin429]|nr:MAG: hypothetical protein BWY76_02193 [bacterium ADurb.Bin429]